jgi:hypothetical protein
MTAVVEAPLRRPFPYPNQVTVVNHPVENDGPCRWCKAIWPVNSVTRWHEARCPDAPHEDGD